MMNENNLETATFAGGCFWCTEAVFQRLKGVVSVVPGYTGGTKVNPTYEDVSKGKTGHAEAIQILYNPEIISYEKLLRIFFYTHNPTTINQQGADRGTQYRSAIFYHDEEQKVAALKVKKEVEQSGVHKGSVVTEIVLFTKFYPAEDYHKNFYNQNQNYPYCTVVINPKIQKLMKEFSREAREN